MSSEYLVLAAELMYLKSKSLLPKDNDKDEDEDSEEITKEKLINRLLDYEHKSSSGSKERAPPLSM